jgi:hypothetical protein
MHKAAVTDRGKQERKREIEAQNACAQVALRNRDGMAGAESNVIKDTAIFPQRHFAFGPSVKIIEDRFRNPAARDGTEILNAHDSRRGYRGFGHAGRYGTTGPKCGETEI